MLFVTKSSILPSNFAISFTNLDEITCLSGSDIKKTVSIFLSSCRFIPANWNSYSKSETALKPLKIIVALFFLHSEVVRILKDKIFNLFLSNLRSLKSEFLIIATRSSDENK